MAATDYLNADDPCDTLGEAERLLTPSINNNELKYGALNEEKLTATCDCLKMRFMLVLLATFGCFNIYAMRTCMGMALVCMVNQSAIMKPFNNSAHNDTSMNCPAMGSFAANDSGDILPSEDGPFDWDENLQGIILSSFFWGYLTTQLVAGFVSDRWGGKWIWALCLLASSIFTMLIPWAASINATMVIVLRILCGVTQGVTFPSLYAIMSKWYPRQERTLLVTLSTVGCSIGVVVSFPVSAALCNSPFLGGWPSIFYLFGGLGVLWFALWSLIITDYPADNSWVTETEKNYIEMNIHCNKQRHKVQIPWLSILTSLPFLSLCINDFAGSFKYFMLLTQLPTYLKVVMNFNIQQNGTINVVPYLIGGAIGVLASCWADAMINSRKLSVSTVRKSLTFTGTVISCICLIGITWAGCDQVEVIAFLWIGLSIDGLSTGGAEMNSFDLSPNFVGTLKGILTTFSAAGGIAAPYIVGILTNNDNTPDGWNKAFYLAAGLYIFGTVTYVIFGSGKTQAWNETDTSDAEPLLKSHNKVKYET